MIEQNSLKLLETVLESASRWEAKERKAAEELIQKFFPVKKLVNKSAIADVLNCSTRQVDYLRENYGLPWIRLGEVIRFDMDDVLTWLESQKSTGPGCVPSLNKESYAERYIKQSK